MLWDIGWGSYMERILWVLTGALVILVILFGVAGVLNPEFRDNSAGFIAALIGPLVTVVGGLGGVIFSRGVRENMKGEALNEEGPKA